MHAFWNHKAHRGFHSHIHKARHGFSLPKNKKIIHDTCFLKSQSTPWLHPKKNHKACHGCNLKKITNDVMLSNKKHTMLSNTNNAWFLFKQRYGFKKTHTNTQKSQMTLCFHLKPHRAFKHKACHAFNSNKKNSKITNTTAMLSNTKHVMLSNTKNVWFLFETTSWFQKNKKKHILSQKPILRIRSIIDRTLLSHRNRTWKYHKWNPSWGLEVSSVEHSYLTKKRNFKPRSGSKSEKVVKILHYSKTTITFAL